MERIVGENDLSAALFSGDDVADVEAFHMLDSLAGQGLLAVKVALRGEDTPREPWTRPPWWSTGQRGWWNYFVS